MTNILWTSDSDSRSKGLPLPLPVLSYGSESSTQKFFSTKPDSILVIRKPPLVVVGFGVRPALYRQKWVLRVLSWNYLVPFPFPVSASSQTLQIDQKPVGNDQHGPQTTSSPVPVQKLGKRRCLPGLLLSDQHNALKFPACWEPGQESCPVGITEACMIRSEQPWVHWGRAISPGRSII